MARPNTMPITTMGRELTIGPVCSTPSRPAPQPHWKSATRAPKVAARLSRKPRVALIGTSTDRNTNMSRRNARPTTTAR
jgi:hypothetical protein